MLLALAISKTDSTQARRLIRWLAFLSEQNHNQLQSEHLLLVLSDHIGGQDDREPFNLADVFGSISAVVVPDHGMGWPGEANRMLLAALRFAEARNAPVLFLEPDGVPLCPDWFERIQKEYEFCGKPFMGGYVPTPPPHMTGIGVYPANWRHYAPSLARVPDSAGWDTWCAEDVNPHAHFTPLIQHVFRRHEPGWSIPGLNALDKRAVIFHQDKYGKLIRLLDEAHFGGACGRHPLFGSQLTDNQPLTHTMTKFYKTVNATRAIVARGGKRFAFDPVESFAGAMPGVYATEIQADQELLDDMANNPTSGVASITQQDYEKLTKKNWIHPVLATSKPSNATLPPPQVPLAATPSGKAAAVVAEPVSVGGDHGGPPGLSQIKDIGDVLKVDTVQPSQPAPGIQSKKPRKPKKG